MLSARAIQELLATSVCRVRAPQGTGTGWLAASGIVVTAGHLLPGGAGESAELLFPGHPAVTARVIAGSHQPGQGIDFAVLEAPVPPGLPALPVALDRLPRGPLVSMGYGVTLGSISAAAGEFVGSYDPGDDAASRLFRCRSTELAEEGYSGAPIVSLESSGVVGVQVEAVTGGRGARDTVLAMPLYRIAEHWRALADIEAAQPERWDGRAVLLADLAPDPGFAGAVARRLTAAGLEVTLSGLHDSAPGTQAAALLRDAEAVLLLSRQPGTDLRRARELVVGAGLRKVPVLLAAHPDAAAPRFLRGMRRLAASADPAATASGMLDGLAALDSDRVASLTALAGALREIQSESADPARFQPHIDELRAMISGWSSRLERQDQRLQVSAAAGPAPREPGPGAVPCAGVRPFDPEYLFRDRIREAEQVSRMLADDSARIITIAGRAGMGKTALAARVLAGLREQRWLFPEGGPRIDGLAFLSTRTSSGITSAEVILKLAQLTDDTSLIRSWSAAGTPVAARIAAVAEAAGDRHIVMLLDNFEDLLSADGEIASTDGLAELLDGLAAAATGLKFLITSRERIRFPPQTLPRCRVVALESGLPAAEAARMLRELDPQAEYGLQQAGDGELARIAGRLHGIPRALQLAVSMLANDPLLTAAELASEQAQLLDEPLAAMIAETHARLDDPARWVLLALAVLGRPAVLGSLDFLVSPFAPGADVPSVTRNLVRAQIVSVDRLTRRLALHPADRAYLLDQAARQRPASVTLLHRRAAQFYVTAALPAGQPRDIEDARPLLFAAEHFAASGDMTAAARLLDQVDELLEYWGYYQTVITLREQLAERLTGDDATQNAMRLGRIHWLAGDAARSASWLRRAQAAVAGDPPGERLAAILVDLAASQRDSGELRGSLGTFRRALRVCREAGAEPLIAARGLLQATHTVRQLGFLDVSLACVLRSGELAQAGLGGEHRSRASFLLAASLINAAVTDRLAGDLATARQRLDRALRAAAEIADRGLEAQARCGRGAVSRAAGTPGQAMPDLLAALEIYEEIGDRWGHASCLATLSWVLADLDDAAAARFVQQGQAVAAGCNTRALASSTLAGAVLARRAGDLARAARLADESCAAYGQQSCDLYLAWAVRERELCRFLAGAAPQGGLPRASPLTRAAWLGLHAVSAVARPGGEPAQARRLLDEAAAAASRVPAAQVAEARLLASQLAAARACLAWDEALGEAAVAPWAELTGAPGLLTDHGLVLSRLAAAGQPGSARLGALIAGQLPAREPA